MNSKQTQTQSSKSNDEKAIRDIHYRMIDAWNAGDAAAPSATMLTSLRSREHT